MEQIKEMLKKMGFKIVADEMKTTEWTENDGYRVDYTVYSYGNEPVIASVKVVEPKEVTKVEYI